MKDPTNMTHAERMSALTRELNSSTCVAHADKILELITHEWLDIRSVRDMAARRHGQTTPAPTMPFAHAESVAEADRKNERQAANWNITSLAHRYKTDAASPYKALRFRTREHYDSLLRRIDADCGEKKLSDLKAVDIQRVYDGWTVSGAAMAHALIGMLRMLVNYGVKLEDAECARLSGILHNMRFKTLKPRTEQLTEKQVVAIVAKAHEMGRHSIALAQAFQFDCRLRQRDCIGEWIPEGEPGEPIISHQGMKWLRGITWQEIDDNLILRHTTSKRGEDIEIDLKPLRMVTEEMQKFSPRQPWGPIIIDENTGLPYIGWEFRHRWRLIARACGIPDKVRNMDTRAGPTGKAASTASASNDVSDFSAEASAPSRATKTMPRRKSGARRSEFAERA